MGLPDLVRGPHGEIVVRATSELQPHVYSPLVTDDWLMRFDGTTGEMLWIERVAPDVSLAVDPVGNIVLVWPTLLQKLDAGGALLWALPRPAQAAFELAEVAVDADGNILVARTELDDSPTRAGADPKGILLLEKLDANGAPLWVRQFGNGTSLVFGAFAAVDGARSVVFWSSWVEGAVDFGGGPLSGKNVLAKFDASGQHLWSKTLGGYASNTFPNPNPVVVDGAGNILLHNQVSGPVDIGLGSTFCTPQIVLKLDAGGAPQWNKCMPVETLSVLPDGGFATSARLFEPITVGGERCVDADEYDGVLALYDKDGNWLKTSCLAAAGYQRYGALIADTPGTFILAGGSSGGLTLPGGLTLAPLAQTAWTAFVAKVAPWN
jgi:hypothetical protein